MIDLIDITRDVLRKLLSSVFVQYCAFVVNDILKLLAFSHFEKGNCFC